jgi:hypothetical protein
MGNIPTPDSYKSREPTPPPTPETYKDTPSGTPPSTPTPTYMPPTTPTPVSADKRRHGCLTAWLLLIIVVNIGLTIWNVVSISQEPHLYYAWAMPVIIIFCVWIVTCAVAIFMWKKWGFYGFCAGAIGEMIVYIIAGNYFYFLMPLVGVAILFSVLNIGKENRGWTQLE